MVFERLDPERHLGAWRTLIATAAGDYGSFRGFRYLGEMIFRGRGKIIANRSLSHTYGLFGTSPAGRKGLLACAVHFHSLTPGLGPTSALGGLAFDPSLTLEEIADFARRLHGATGAIDLAPFNGHLSLGLSHPGPETRPEQVSFLCAPVSRQTGIFLRETGVFEKCRTLYALTTELGPKLVEEARAGLKATEARGFTSRPLSLMSFKRDIAIYNGLVNEAMRHHAHFFPLTIEEEWELWRGGQLMLKPSWFRFLMHRGREIGVCFAIPDYNRVLRSDRGDLPNFIHLGRERWFERPKRARLVYSCLKPEYQGQGLFKAVRHQVILEMSKDGVTEFESSYVDEANRASRGNVASTGGRDSHEFHLYRSRP